MRWSENQIHGFCVGEKDFEIRMYRFARLMFTHRIREWQTMQWFYLIKRLHGLYSFERRSGNKWCIHAEHDLLDNGKFVAHWLKWNGVSDRNFVNQSVSNGEKKIE